MILEKIRAALPTHIMLTPGVHRWRDGDEEYIDSEENFMGIDPHCAGCIVDHEGGRRPIPQYILDNQAFWVLFDKLADRSPQSLGGVALELERGLRDYQNVRVLIHNVRGLFFGHTRRFSTENAAYEAMENLGGARKIIENLSIGRLYDKWLLEQMEDV